MEVKNHIVLFLDILGYSNIVTSCQDSQDENCYLERIHNLMSSLSAYIERWNSDIDQQRNSLNLSRFKSLLFFFIVFFFAPYENETDMINLYMNLLYGLSTFLVQYIKEDLFFRGGIAKGNLFYDEKLHFVFGSGLVKAYSIESNVAKYPRIVIDQELNPSDILVGIVQDEKRIWYLDYLSLGHSLICFENKPQQNYEYFLSCLDEQKNAIIDALKKYKNDDKILCKYQWLAEYHNNYCKENGLGGLVI